MMPPGLQARRDVVLAGLREHSGHVLQEAGYVDWQYRLHPERRMRRASSQPQMSIGAAMCAQRALHPAVGAV